MVGPTEALMVLRRDETLAGFMELVCTDSRIKLSEDERREVSIGGGCACDCDRSLCGDGLGIEGGRSSASSECRSDFNLQLYQR